ncbi:heat shock protein HtpX [Micromonospora sp. MW-13]|uniref:M48 family metalloprotease n=1 Tax=Micromonospora sp. MW-13 TaxID=2094022 RepID=UPI000E44F737|nr:M48 family metalloprotease [Micromonospora sp. MW-13]RGC67085.1 heat shock protein HtpX [Micromonospora sp. MW-13]
MHEPDPDQQIRPAVTETPTGPRPGEESRLGRRFASRPPGYPSVLVWLRAGVLRDWRGVLGAFLATWFYVPVALFLGVCGAIAVAVAGMVNGGLRLGEFMLEVLRDAPLVGALLDAFLNRSGGVLGGFLGVGIGFLAGFLLVLVLPMRDGFDEPANLVTGLAGMVAAAALVGVLYTLYRIMWEPRLLAISGARRLSRREAERLCPILDDCARALGLPAVPRLLIEDDPVLTNARAYARHIVVTTGMLDESDEGIAALLSHELVHWRTGDEVTSAFVRGVGLPLVLVHAVPTWLMRTFPHPGTNFVVFVFFWPVLLTMKYLVLPLHSRDVRAAEYRADAGAVLAGHAQGLRDMLERRKSFESGRSGWDEAVCATHPAAELRLDRLERLAPPAGAADRAAGGAVVEPAVPVTAEGLFGRPGTIASPGTVLVAGVLALACALGGTLLGAAQWAFFRPATAVDGYFSALADHDARAALESLDPGARPSGGDLELLAALVEAKGYQPPKDVDVTSIEREGDEAVATVAFTLAGQKTTANLHLEREESATLGLFHGWRITGSAPWVGLPAGQPALTINGVPVQTGQEGRSVPLLPGAYTVGGQSNALAETPAQIVLALPGEGGVGDVRLEPTLTSTARSTAEQEVRKYLDACAAQQVAAPEGCPFRYYNGGTVKKIAWKITEYPQVELTLTGPATARVSTPYEAQGTVRATGTTEGYYGTSSPFTDDDTFDVTGVLSLVDGKLTFQPGE